MTFAAFFRDARGAVAIETALTAPLFCFVVVGICQAGQLMWTQMGLQRGAEMAARCATINPTLCSSTSATQRYAAAQTYGLNPPASAFSVNVQSCGTLVTASHAVGTLASLFGAGSVMVTARSCFPR